MKLLAGMIAPLFVLANTLWAQNERDSAVRTDRLILADSETWFYDDLAAGTQAAARAKQPLMIVFR